MKKRSKKLKMYLFLIDYQLKQTKMFKNNVYALLRVVVISKVVEVEGKNFHHSLNQNFRSSHNKTELDSLHYSDAMHCFCRA